MKADDIQEKYYASSTVDMTYEQAGIAKRDLKRGLKKLKRLPQNEPLRAEAIELFEVTFETMKAIRDQNKQTEELIEIFEGNARTFKNYISAFEREGRK